MLLAEEINNKKKDITQTVTMWNSSIASLSGSNQKNSRYTLNNYSYPFWGVSHEYESTLYRGIISEIENNNVTIGIENLQENQMEYYIFPKDFFNFSIKNNQIVDIIAEKKNGECCLRPKEYKKSEYYIEKEYNILNNLTNEDDDF